MARLSPLGKRPRPMLPWGSNDPQPIIGFAAVIGVIICVLIIAFASDK
jgi:hypothetical protein